MKTKTMTRVLSMFLLIAVSFLFSNTLNAQSVLDPNDPVITYNAATPPTQPVWGEIGKWVRRKRLNWNTDGFKCYIYKNMAFRLKFPKSYNPTANDGKKYPMLVFFHGLGEGGTIYDNEYQLYHGGQFFNNSVNNGTFDGFILTGQSASFWGGDHWNYIRDIIDYMVVNNKLDPFQIANNGLSAGGNACWNSIASTPTYYTATLPMCGIEVSFANSTLINNIKYKPIWYFQGALDGSPTAYTAKYVRDQFLAAGANFNYKEYPTLAHGIWNTVWAEPDFFPFINRSYGSNPWPLNGKSQFCPGETINTTIGLAPGFDQYEWRKNGVLIAGATGNTIQVSGTGGIGVYSARIRKGSVWSEWSRTPVEIKVKEPTVPPTIAVSGLMSKVLPPLDDNTGVTLRVPENYISYQWEKVGNSTSLGNTNTLYATSPGDYRVKVSEPFGCASEFSSSFTVIDANGPNKPDPAINLIITPFSKTSLKLDWSDNPVPTNDETNFEVYQANEANGSYTLIAIVNANVLTYTAIGLNANTSYYFKVRAINNTGAAPASNTATGKTLADLVPPTAPTNLAIVGSTRSSISLSWTAATDDVGVTKYDVYVNGIKSYVTTQTQFTAYTLQFGQTYNFAIKARDLADNVSPFSNQVTGQALLMGLPYKYYTFTGTWNNLPNFTTLTPVTTGVMPNVALTPRTQNDNFAFLWEGYINIPVTGTYYFRTNSDDGSRLWLGTLNGTGSPYSFSGTPTVNNDGLHGTQDRTSAALNLTAGIYPIAIAFYEQGGGEAMTVRWRTPLSGTNYDIIPSSAFGDSPIVLGGPPAAPSGLLATAVSFNQIDLSWADNSADETGFEIWRSTSINSGFTTVGVAPVNATSYSDLNLNPNTTYYYQLRTIGQYGESQLVGNVNVVQANWKFNNNYTDASGNNRTLTANNTPTFSTDNQEGTHSVDLNGTDEDLTVNTSTGDFLRGGYNRKTVAFWLRADNTSNNSGVFDFGGTDDGLSMRLNANVLHAGIVSNNTGRRSITTPYTSTGWNHIALVYNSSELALYVNGVQVAANNALPFTSVGTTTDGSMIGDDNGGNSLNTGFGQLNGRIDNFYIVDKALSVEELTKLMNDQELGENYATTLPLPAAPANPENLLATGISNSKINVNWTDVANEISYEVYRSSNNNSNYVLLSTVPANTVSYQDTGLFANATYYYQVRAVNVGGPSGYSNEDSAATANNIPVLTPIENQYMRYGTQLQLAISATDMDPELLSIQFTGLPSSFSSFSATGNGTGLLTFTNPLIGDMGTYSINVSVADQNGGMNSVNFNLVIGDNYTPVVNSVANINVNENETGQVNISSTDQNAGDQLTWSFIGLPSFATPSALVGNTVQLNITPGYADNGSYNVIARVEDGNNGFDTVSFVINVIDVIPNTKIYVNFTYSPYLAPTPWNNTNKQNPSLNDNFPAFKDEIGNTTSIGMQITSPWQNIGNAINNYGVNTGNNSGVYPDQVISTAYFTTSPVQTMRIYGLNPSTRYNFTFFGSRGNVNDNRSGTYTIGGTSVTLNAANNSQNTVSINNVLPQPDGSLVLSLSKTAASSFAYINAMVIEAIFDDGSAPARPRNLVGQVVNGKSNLTWIDAAYNESAYEVYRATNIAGPYALLQMAPNTINLTHFVDSSVIGNSSYYYTVRAINSNGNSPFSDTVLITTPNGSPLLSPIADVSIRTQQITTVNILAVDDVTNTITLQVNGLPSFATFTDNGNGTGTINIAPGNTIGNFTGITVIATDNMGASSSIQFRITVTDGNITSYYVNFNNSLPEGYPWNNFNSLPNAGVVLANLKDDGGNTTGLSVTLVDKWENVNDIGASTGNNSGIYPDNVMKTNYFEGTSNSKRIRISGLSTSNVKYNLTFFASRGGVNDNRNTTYSYAGQSVTLNAANNATNVVRILGVVPDANGVIEFTAQKAVGAAYGYIAALVIQSYVDNGIPLAPDNLKAVPVSKTSIQLSWNDKSNNEDGFEIYRGLSANGTFTLLATTQANVNGYLDQGLQAGVVYYYKVRAKRLPVFFSSFSNLASSSTLTYSVYVNMNDANPAGVPWNNTNNAPIEDDIYTNLKDENLNSTGINMTVLGKDFSGVNTLGVNTGNNSGVFPDNVMRSTWWLDVSGIGRLKIDGLNQSMSYNFVFFASRDLGGTGGDRTTRYTIGTQSVLLNAADNRYNTVVISNVKPDENGTVEITIQAGNNSVYGYIGALVIQSYSVGSTGSQTGGSSSGRGVEFVSGQDDTINLSNAVSSSAITQTNRNSLLENYQLNDVSDDVSIYPNPFMEAINVKLNLPHHVNRLSLVVLDASGRFIRQKELNQLPQGVSLHNLNLENLLPGLYYLLIRGIDDNKPRIIKIVKGR